MKDNYSDEPDESEVADRPGMGEEAQAGDDQDKTEDNTALLPTSFFKGGADPGHECKVRIVHNHGEECEVQYVDADKPDEPEPTSQRERSMGALRSMSKE